MTHLVVVRHGETAWNAEGRIQGHQPVPLNERGRKQAEALAACLAKETNFGDDLVISIFDYGGQKVFEALHSLFLTSYGVYICCFNMLKLADPTAPACGEELAERLQEEQATKVLTVEATGLLPAMFVGKALGLPVIFARKSRQIGVSDSYQASYKSQVKSSTSDVYVSTEYLTAGDRVIIIDDFLAGGTTADALVRVCRMAGATVVGGGFLIEKATDAGRAYLSG